jgi:NhaA family Na+:H+ antiporter
MQPMSDWILAPRRFVAERFIRPLQEYVSTEAWGGIVLLIATVIALAWANSPWDGSYFHLWERNIALDTSFVSLHLTFHDAVNDGLMTVFFFVVGLEIKRELLHGELASPRKAALPVAAALGGMIVPALIYTAWNAGGDGAHGWGIPMATDIAFALGVLALLGRRVPFSLTVFVLALAIVDDLGAILVIAVFYTDHISVEALSWAIAIAVVIFVVARAGLRAVDAYVALGALLWLAVFKSGIHATIAGVTLAALTPANPFFRPEEFEPHAESLLATQREALAANDSDTAAAALRDFERLSHDSEAPLDRLVDILHPWTSYLIVPIFALANAGVSLRGGVAHDAANSAVTFGILTGLVLGKPAGILLFSWLAVRTRMASLPANVSFVHVLGAGVLAGIGFTVSLFITGLAFDQAPLISDAKVGILAASVIAGTAGFIYLSLSPGEPEPQNHEGTKD